MKNSFWVVVVIVAFAFGVLVGYGVWGPGAAKLPQLEQQVSALQSQVMEMRSKEEGLEAHLRRLTNDKLNLEKQNGDLKDALAKSQKVSQVRALKRRR